MPPGTPRVMQRSHGVWFIQESVRLTRLLFRMATAASVTGILPLGGSTTMDRRRAFRGALPGPSAKPLTSRTTLGSTGAGGRGGWLVPGNHFASGASRWMSTSLGASNGVRSKFVQTPWMSG